MKSAKAVDVNESKRVGIWIRVSTEDQAQGESPHVHEKRARSYAESKGWNVVDVYHLEAVSGKAVMQHPEAKRMLADVKRGHITGIIFSKLARLARNTKELLEFSDYFREYEADLISLGESIDTSTPAGRLFYTIIAAMAQWEREEIAARISASIPIRAKMGKNLGGAAPFGYAWNGHQLIIDPKEAPIRKLMYELFLEHRRFRSVATVLNEKGYRTRAGKRFTGHAVERLITDPTAKGVRRSNYTKSRGKKGQWDLKPEQDWVYTSVEAIISEEVWNQCNRLVEERLARRAPVAKKTVHLFAGFVFCECGGKMYVPSGNPKYTCFTCHTKIPPTDLEVIYEEQLGGYLFSTDKILAGLDESEQVIKEKEEQLKLLHTNQAKLRQSMDRVTQLYIDGNISGEGFKLQYRPLEEQLSQIVDQIPVLQGEVDFLKIQVLSSDQILRDAQDVHDRWSLMNQEEKRMIVETTLSRVTISKDEVKIELTHLPVSSEITAIASQNLRAGYL